MVIDEVPGQSLAFNNQSKWSIYERFDLIGQANS